MELAGFYEIKIEINVLKDNETMAFGYYHHLEGKQTFNLIHDLAFLANWIP